MLKSILTATRDDVDSYSPLQAQWLSQALIQEKKFSADEYSHSFFLEFMLALKPDSQAYIENRLVLDRVLLPLIRFSNKRLSVFAASLLVRLVQADFQSLWLLAYAVHRSPHGPKITVENLHKMFPHGLPTAVTVQRFWADQQQVINKKLVNLLFLPKTWE